MSKLLDTIFSNNLNLSKMNNDIKKEDNPYLKKALSHFHEDICNDNFPEIQFTPECEAIYIRAFLNGAYEGLGTSLDIINNKDISKEESPTLNRYGTGISNPNAHENLN